MLSICCRLDRIAIERMRQDSVINPLFQLIVNVKKVKIEHGNEVLLETELCLRGTGRPDVSEHTEN